MDQIYSPYIVIEPPVRMPISISELKNFLSLDECDNQTEAMLKLIILSVARYFEKYTGRTLINTKYRTFREYFNCYLLLKRSKFQELTLFQYLINNVFTTVDPSIYQITEEVNYSSIWSWKNNSFPSTDCVKQAIKIEFIAGYGEKEKDIPEDVRQALLMHANYLYANRGDCDCSDAGSAIPPSSKAIYSINKIYDLTSYPVP